MTYVRICLALLFASVIAVGGLLVAQEIKKPPDPPSRVRGQLPANWSKLGLTDQQRQKAYSIQGKYDKEVEALQAQINELRQKEKTELASVLTDEQKKRLRELLSEKVPGAADEKKPPPDKK